MPYRRAWIWLAALLALTSFAFWPSYLSGLGAASFEIHAHSATAFLWMILLTVQSWSIHAGRRTLHRQLGIVSLALFPAFLAGGLLISVGMAKRLVAREDLFHELFAARLSPVDAAGVAGIAWCFYCALRHRRKVHLHARYMLATVLFLFGPIALRILTLYGPFAIHSDAEYYRIADVLRVTTAATLAGLAFLVWRAPRHGRPWIEAGGFIALQALLFETLGTAGWWREIYPRLAEVPAVPLALVGSALGAAIVWLGWTHGRRGPRAGLAPAAA
jgi:hypothetical protein